MKRESTFLTIEQALEAVRRDFRQYDPQVVLLCEALRLITGGDTVVKRDRQRSGAWISAAGRTNMRWMDGPELVDYVCTSLPTIPMNPELVSSLCAMVFQTRAFPAVGPETGRRGIRIETGMEHFVCRQCGQCCRSLDYHDQVTAEDVAIWRESGRTDILEWVGVFERDGHETAYRIWVTPGTLQLTEVCPFFQEVPSENRWICRIHSVKPAICRQYPASRKHALMTGCRGFERQGQKRRKR